MLDLFSDLHVINIMGESRPEYSKISVVIFESVLAAALFDAHSAVLSWLSWLYGLCIDFSNLYQSVLSVLPWQ